MNNMKTAFIFFTLILLTESPVSAFLFPTNPPAVVSINIAPSSDPTVTNYFIYYGVGSRQYTNKTAVGNVTNVSIPLPTRGITYFFGATAQDNQGLESTNFSNEVSYTPKNPPGSPGLGAPITITIQSSPTLNPPMWADTDAVWSITPEEATLYYRTVISQSLPLASAQSKLRPSTRLPNATMKFPPNPMK